MGLLDQLREESSSAKDKEHKEARRLEALQKAYDEKVTPKLEQVWSFLKELEQHLNYLQPEVHASYDVPGFGHFENLNQSEYKMEKGRKTLLTRVPFRFACSSGATLKKSIDGNRKLAAIIEQLDQTGLKYECKKQRDANSEVFGGDIELQAKVPVSITFEGVVETAGIEMVIKNYNNLSSAKTYLNPDHIDEAFLDQLGNFILRKENSFLKMELTDEQKEHFKKMVLADQQARAEELEDKEEK